MKIAVVTANLGNFEQEIHPISQSVPVDVFKFNDTNFLPRYNALTPRLQSKIPKMFAWQMCPGYDYYIWIDGSFAFFNVDSVKWFIEQCEGVDAAFFRHPYRKTIQEESDFVRYRIKVKSRYFRPRYQNELFDGLLAEINQDKTFVDNILFASGFFIYRDCERARNMLKEWWYFTSRYNNLDQLSLPYVIHKTGCIIRIIEEDYNKSPYLTFMRKK